MRLHILPWVLPALFLIIWQVSGDYGWISTRLIPTPFSVASAAYRLVVTGELWGHLFASSVRALTGFALGASLGLMLGILTGAARIAALIFDTSLQMLRNIPHLALLPMVIIWFGVDEWAKIFLVALGVFFPVYLNTYHGVRSIDAGLLEMGRVYGLSKYAMFRHVLLPGALPNILVGIRYSLGIMWLTLIVGETVAANSGIGYLAMNAREFLRTDIVVVTIILYALLGKLADAITRLIEHRFLPWKPEHQR